MHIKKDNQIFLSDWKILNVSGARIPIFVGRNDKGDVTDKILKSPKKKIFAQDKNPQKHFNKTCLVRI